MEPSFAVSLKDTPPQDPSGGPASDDATTVVETVEMDLGAPDGSLTTQTIERDAKKQLVTLTVERPLGIVFEENAKGEVVAVEVLEGNGKSAGVKEGGRQLELDSFCMRINLQPSVTTSAIRH